MPKHYIEFNLVDKKEKTFVYAVMNRESQDVLGYIKWYGPWRQYCFFPEPTCVFSVGCMLDIVNFTNGLRL
jgi:hypothetical protein